jgi:hypothetical protein
MMRQRRILMPPDLPSGRFGGFAFAQLTAMQMWL